MKGVDKSMLCVIWTLWLWSLIYFLIQKLFETEKRLESVDSLIPMHLDLPLAFRSKNPHFPIISL